MAKPTASQDSRTFFLIAWIGFLGIASTTISKNPVLPLFVQQLGGNESLLGTIAAVSPLAGILFSFPVGAFSDQMGRKNMLLLSALVFVLAPLLYLVVQEPGWLIPIRFFHGLATAILGPVASALIVSLFPEQKGLRLGTYSSVTLIGRTLAPLLGGFILTAFAYLNPPVNYRLVYLAAFLLALPILAAVWFIPDHASGAPSKKPDMKTFIQAFRDFSRSPVLMAVALADMATYFAFGVLETYLPLFLKARQVSAEGIGLIFSLQILAIALTKPLFGRLADRFDNRWQILLGLAALGISLVLLPMAEGFWAWVAIAMVFGLGMSFGTVATSAYTAELARREQVGAALGALSSVMDIGHAGGPFLTGFVVAATTQALGFHFAAGVCGLVAVIFAVKAFSGRTA